MLTPSVLKICLGFSSHQMIGVDRIIPGIDLAIWFDGVREESSPDIVLDFLGGF